MDKIYVVWNNGYDDEREIAGVFSSRPRAMKLSRAFGDESGEYIEEHNVDDEVSVKQTIAELRAKERAKEE